MEERLKRSSMHWFGIRGPLDASAPATTGAYRTAAQKAEDQVLLADGLKAEYVTRMAANSADMFAFWPNHEHPTHLIFCTKGDGGILERFYRVASSRNLIRPCSGLSSRTVQWRPSSAERRLATAFAVLRGRRSLRPKKRAIAAPTRLSIR